MSAQPVDVLAVMLADALAAEDWRVLKTGDRNGASARKFSDEARAAVAELVAAVKAEREARTEATLATGAAYKVGEWEAAELAAKQARTALSRAVDRVGTALARVQGGAG